MFVLPLWALITASALTLWPELRGTYVFDPFADEVTFEEYRLLVQWFRGGAVAALGMAALLPVMGAVALIATGAGALGRSRSSAEAARIRGQAGEALVDVDIVVRKRRRGTADKAVLVQVVDASPLRRLLAKALDGLALAASGAGGGMLGVLGMFGTFDWGAIALGWPLVGAGVAMGAMCVVQWAGAVDRGQTLGKMALDLREVTADERPLSRSAVLFRDALPSLLGAGIATGTAVLLGLLAVQLVREQLIPGVELVSEGGVQRVDLAVLPWVVGTIAAPVLWAGFAGLRGLPLLWGRPAWHDLGPRTPVVRTALGDLPDLGARAPAGPRIVARSVDLTLELGALGLPFGLAVGWMLGAGSVTGVGVLAGLGASALLLAGVLAGQTLLFLRSGATVGKRLLGLRVERIDGQPLGVSDGVLAREIAGARVLWFVLPGIGMGIDLLGVLADDRRALHDHVASTHVVWTARP